jgi:CYTH domain-containing protein
VTTVDVEQIYLPADSGAERRCRRQVGGGYVTYTVTEKRSGSDPLVRHESEAIVGYDAWQDAEASGGPRVHKRRHVFVHDGQRFELDELLEPRQAWLLEVELASPDDEVRLPDFLVIDREVTDDPGWRNAVIARDTLADTPAPTEDHGLT